jgi:hypothetical protein
MVAAAQAQVVVGAGANTVTVIPAVTLPAGANPTAVVSIVSSLTSVLGGVATSVAGGGVGGVVGGGATVSISVNPTATVSVSIDATATVSADQSTTVTDAVSTNTAATATTTGAAATSTMIGTVGRGDRRSKVHHRFFRSGERYCRNWRTRCVNYQPRNPNLYFQGTQCTPGDDAGRYTHHVATAICE